MALQIDVGMESSRSEYENWRRLTACAMRNAEYQMRFPERKPERTAPAEPGGRRESTPSVAAQTHDAIAAVMSRLRLPG